MLDAAPKPAASMRVLVVDDEVNLRFAIERRLQREEMETASASTVRQAIDQLRAEAFDVVLCDLRMPGGDGTQLLQWLGSYSPSTKVVVVSAFVTSEFRSQYGPAGLRVLEKPVDLDVLVGTLHEIGPRRGFFGNEIEVELFDYVQMVAISGRDKLIEVRTAQSSGLIWFEHGDIVHVQYGEFRGERAFYKLLACNRGGFREQFFRPPPMRTVLRSSTHLLMEAARQADEGTLGKTPSEIAAPADDEASFRELAEALDADEEDADDVAAEVHAEPLLDGSAAEDDLEQFILGDDEDPPLGWEDPEPEEVIGDVSDASDAVPAAKSDSMSGDLFSDPETRKLLLEQFWAYEGVDGVAIISSTGKVLAEDMRNHGALVTLAGFYMRGAARIARDLGYNVFDGVIARSVSGEQMVMVSMGATSAVLSVEVGCDPEAVRDAVLGDG